jgi:predicted MFS family arabinose efflux permease
MFILKKIICTYKEAYTGLPKSAWLLSMVEFINRSGTMVFFFMTLYLTQTFGFSAAQAGKIISAYGVGGLLGAYLGGKLSDTMGAYKVQKISLALSGVCYIWLGYLSSYFAFLIMMFVLAVVSETLHPANSTAMSQVCPSELRTKGFALNRLAINLGVTIGPALGGYLALINYKLLFWVDGITCLVAALVFIIFFKTDRPPLVEPKKSISPATSPWKDFYFIKILIFCFLSAMVFVQLFTTYPLYFRSFYFFRENHIGLLLAINTVIIVIFEMVLINAIKNKSQLKIMAIGELLLCLGFALIPMGRGFLYAAFTVLIWTIGEMLTFPTLTAHVADISTDSIRGKYMGLFSISFALAMVVGPTLGSQVYDNLGPNVVWYACGIMGVLLFLGFLSLQSKSVSKNEMPEDDGKVE